jgi:hypothetical protein
LELQEAVVAVQAAKRLTNPVEHSFAQPISLGRILWTYGQFVWRDKQPGEMTHHRCAPPALAGIETAANSLLHQPISRHVPKVWLVS